jgi:hypothetical protein
MLCCSTATATWSVRFEDHQPTLTSTSMTVFHESARRRYSEAQPGCRWIEYESPLNTLHTIPNSDRVTPPPPYVPLQEAELPPPLPPPPDIELSEEQQRVLRLVKMAKTYSSQVQLVSFHVRFLKRRNQRTIFQEPENLFY